MSVLPSFAERKRVWVFRRCTLSNMILVRNINCLLVSCVIYAGESGGFDGAERVHLRNTHTRLRSANEGNTDMGVP